MYPCVEGQRLLAGALMLVALVLACAAPCAHAEDEMVLYYIDRPPLSYTDPNGKPRGILVDISERVMKQAGIAFHWEESSARRILNTIAFESNRSCSPGWYDTSERRQFALFSERVYAEGAPGAIVSNSALSKVRSSARETLEQGIVLLRKDGFAMIPYLQRIINTLPPERVVHTDRDTRDLPAMIGAQHGEIAFMPPSEAEYWLEHAPVKGITAVRFPDLPTAGEARYFMCGRATPPDEIARINHALSIVAPTPIEIPARPPGVSPVAITPSSSQAPVQTPGVAAPSR